MPAWPVSLPAAPLADRFREVSANTVIRTEMDSGPAKVRRRTTAGVRVLSFDMLLSKAQTATLDSFYQTTTTGGSLAFDFTHPRTGSMVSCRFRKPPEYAPTNANYFRAQIELEILP